MEKIWRYEKDFLLFENADCEVRYQTFFFVIIIHHENVKLKILKPVRREGRKAGHQRDLNDVSLVSVTFMKLCWHLQFFNMNVDITV